MVCRYQAAVEIWDLVVDQRCWTLIVVRQAETVRHTGHVQKLIAQHIWTCTDRKQRWKYQEFNHQMYVSVCFHVCSLTDSEPFWSKEHSPCNIYHKVHVILDNLILIGISSRGIWVQTETRFPVFLGEIWDNLKTTNWCRLLMALVRFRESSEFTLQLL